MDAAVCRAVRPAGDTGSGNVRELFNAAGCGAGEGETDPGAEAMEVEKVNERTPFEKDVIAAVRSLAWQYESMHPEDAAVQREIRVARLLCDSFEQNGLRSAAELVCTMGEWSERFVVPWDAAVARDYDDV